MALKENKVVTINFTLTDEMGNLIESTANGKPFSFISGTDQLLPRLENNIGEMLIGSKRTVTLSPEDAYGDYSDSAVQIVDRSDFPQGTDLEVGMNFIADTPDGRQMPFVIKNVEGDDITLDFNHPLAGHALTFEVELLNLRDATPEELAHGHAHGDGGHHH